MRAGAKRFDLGRPARRRGRSAVPGVLLIALLLSAPAASPAASRPAPGAGVARVHAICSGPNSAHVPCRFSTPSGDVRCVWTPKPNNVACKLRGTHHAYRLRPTGRATVVRLSFARAGRALPLNQQLVFPGSLSCRDTRRAMICNQDFGLGAFTLAPSGSHHS
jgi:hypothetical protein